MAGLRLGGGREDRFGQRVAFTQTFGQWNAADSASLQVLLPSGAGEIASRDALDLDHLGAAHPHGPAFELLRKPGHVGAQEMIGHDVAQEIQPEQRHPREDASFLGDSGGENVVERRNPVRSDDQQPIAVLVDIAHFAAAAELEPAHLCLEQDILGGHLGFGSHSQLY